MVRASSTFHGPVHNNVCVCVCKSTFERISASSHFIEGSAFIKPHNTFPSYWSNNAVLKFIIMMLWRKFTTGCKQAWQHIIWRSSKMSSGWTKQFCSWESLHIPFFMQSALWDLSVSWHTVWLNHFNGKLHLWLWTYGIHLLTHSLTLTHTLSHTLSLSLSHTPHHTPWK